MSKSKPTDWEASGNPKNLPVPIHATLPQKPRRGRPPALDAVKKRELCALLSAGSGLARAAQYLGCAPSTIRREARRNPEFDKQMRDAELHAQLEPLRAVRAAASKNWRAAAWYLERVEPERFTRRPAKTLKPEAIIEALEDLREVIAAEIKNEDLHDRVVRRVTRLIRKWEREADATEPTTTRK